MDKNEKQQFILLYIENYYEDFQKQAYIKLKRSKKILNIKQDLYHQELLSDVLYSIIEKFKDEKKLDRFYLMAKEDKLCLYIYKAIDINCSSFQAPFLQKNIKKRGLPFNDNIDTGFIQKPAMDSDTEKFEEMSNEKKILIKKVYKLLEPENAKRIFGPHWKYFILIFHEYMDKPKTSYKKIALKYSTSEFSIYNHLHIMYNKIKKEINK